MSAESVRVLLVADTHLGFDLPFRPRIERRRRGPDFFANFERALRPALRGEADLVIHGGDLFYRSRFPAALVQMAMAPLIKVADHGIPVYIVPGNHERSRIPLDLWSVHPNIHIFDRPRTFLCPTGRATVALAGFPFSRNAREAFGALIDATGHGEVAAGIRLLCIHQTVEGAQVGPSNYTFRSGPDVIRGRQIPGGFGAILAGHIHRAQMLTHDLAGRPMAAPVIYPGSVERTSFAERNEDKVFVMTRFTASGRDGGQLTDVSFVPLPARPMVDLTVESEGLSVESLTRHVRERLSALDPEAVVRVQVRGSDSQEARELLSAARLRALAPPTMNIHLAQDRQDRRGFQRNPAQTRRR